MAFTQQDLSVMDSIIARYPRPRSAIMPLLHYVQSRDGFVTHDGIEIIAKKLELEMAEVSAVSTFIPSTSASQWANITLASVPTRSVR